MKKNCLFLTYQDNYENRDIDLNAVIWLGPVSEPHYQKTGNSEVGPKSVANHLCLDSSHSSLKR